MLKAPKWAGEGKQEVEAPGVGLGSPQVLAGLPRGAEHIVAAPQGCCCSKLPYQGGLSTGAPLEIRKLSWFVAPDSIYPFWWV